MSTPAELFDLDFNNWHQWESVDKMETNQFKDSESAINRGIKFISSSYSVITPDNHRTHVRLHGRSCG